MLTIHTPYGKKFFINEKQEIIRTDMDFKPSGQWKFLGLEHVKNNQFVPYDRVIERLKSDPEVFKTYKNGNPQWTVRDLDHGTTRVWGNTKFHGVKSIRIEE
jgi:hypothetical protein